MKLGRGGKLKSFTSVVNFRVVPGRAKVCSRGVPSQQTPYQVASATNRLHTCSNGLQEYGKKCNTYYWFYSEIKFLCVLISQDGLLYLKKVSMHTH